MDKKIIIKKERILVKKTAIFMVVVMTIMALVGCTEQKVQTTATTVQEVSYENGTYRGTFSDGGSMQVGVEFKLENNIVKEAKLRYLEYKGVNYLKEETDKTIIGLAQQYKTLFEHLVEKDIRESLGDLYEPGNIVTENVDAFTGATIRAGKIISATRDALNRGVYSY